MKKLEQAIKILTGIRSRLRDDLADQIVAEQQGMMLSTRAGADPLAADPVMDRLTRGLSNVNRAIAELQAAGGGRAAPKEPSRASRPGSGRIGFFSAFQRLVAVDRLQEAARELSRLIRLPGDCAFTATRFYARTVRSDPSVASRVNSMCEKVDSATVSKCMKTLISAFGLQAVESMTAIQAIRDARRTAVEAARV